MKITTEQLQATLGGSHILKGVSIEVSDKDFVGIIGPNGSGKSTLLKSIYRVLTPQSGTVFLDGNALTAINPKNRPGKWRWWPSTITIILSFRCRMWC